MTRVAADSPGSPQELAAAFARALAGGDVAAALALWAPGAKIVTADGAELQGHEAIGAALRALIDNGARVEIELERTIEAGDVAVGVGTLTLSGTGQDGEPFRQRSRSTVVYARAADGVWRIALDAPWGLPGD